MNNESITLIKKNLQPLTGQKSDYDSLMKMAEKTRFVFIGDSTHGTKEFYKMRAEFTKRLIKEQNFTAVAIEGDWADTYHVNRYINGGNQDSCATKALENFGRFPTWMWQNQEVLSFIKWLRSYNKNEDAAIRFYGLDLYGMNSSVGAVIDYLDKIDEKAAARARHRYSCLDNFAAAKPKLEAINESCEEQILLQLIDLRKNAFEYIKRDGFSDKEKFSSEEFAGEEFFCAEQNALLVKDAQKYYRSLYRGESSSWNLRDFHMANSLEEIAMHLERIYKKPGKVVVWAHNSHIGDARATEMIGQEELNLGQIMRERHGKETLLVGLLTYQGAVSAASNWDMPVESKILTTALKGSIEHIFHETEVANFVLNFRDNEDLKQHLNFPLLQRFVGVIYLPQIERLSHYCYASISRQFDALIYLDKTSAVEPLKVQHHWRPGELDETYPSGL